MQFFTQIIVSYFSDSASFILLAPIADEADNDGLFQNFQMNNLILMWYFFISYKLGILGHQKAESPLHSTNAQHCKLTV